jgi:hypothetical protein
MSLKNKSRIFVVLASRGEVEHNCLMNVAAYKKEVDALAHAYNCEQLVNKNMSVLEKTLCYSDRKLLDILDRPESLDDLLQDRSQLRFYVQELDVNEEFDTVC